MLLCRLHSRSSKKSLVNAVHKRLFATILFFATAVPVWAGSAYLSTPTLHGSLPMKTWKDLRDDRVVKQDLDYSCGAASVATLLSEYYRKQGVTEQQILAAMNKNMAASFQDLAEVVRDYGLKGMGLALDFEQLKQLKMPAIAYLEYRGDAHFSVIRGVAADGTVHLGDPSWGNRVFSRDRFLAMWETRDDEKLKGKILLILPQSGQFHATDPDFFSPPTRNPLPEILLGLR